MERVSPYYVLRRFTFLTPLVLVKMVNSFRWIKYLWARWDPLGAGIRVVSPVHNQHRTPMLVVVLPVGVHKVGLPIHIQVGTDGHRHGTRRRPPPIHMLQVEGKPQRGTRHHGHPIRIRRVEDKHLHGTFRLVHRIRITAVAAVVRQADGAAQRQKRVGDGEIAAVRGADPHQHGVKHRVV